MLPLRIQQPGSVLSNTTTTSATSPHEHSWVYMDVNLLYKRTNWILNYCWGLVELGSIMIELNRPAHPTFSEHACLWVVPWACMIEACWRTICYFRVSTLREELALCRTHGGWAVMGFLGGGRGIWPCLRQRKKGFWISNWIQKRMCFQRMAHHTGIVY